MINNTSKVTIAKTGDDHMENQKIRIIKKTIIFPWNTSRAIFLQ